MISPLFAGVQKHLQNGVFTSGSISVCLPLFVQVGVLLGIPLHAPRSAPIQTIHGKTASCLVITRHTGAVSSGLRTDRGISVATAVTTPEPG